jgi:hypothetical protein
MKNKKIIIAIIIVVIIIIAMYFIFFKKKKFKVSADATKITPLKDGSLEVETAKGEKNIIEYIFDVGYFGLRNKNFKNNPNYDFAVYPKTRVKTIELENGDKIRIEDAGRLTGNYIVRGTWITPEGLVGAYYVTPENIQNYIQNFKKTETQEAMFYDKSHSKAKVYEID